MSGVGAGGGALAICPDGRYAPLLMGWGRDETSQGLAWLRRRWPFRPTAPQQRFPEIGRRPSVVPLTGAWGRIVSAPKAAGELRVADSFP